MIYYHHKHPDEVPEWLMMLVNSIFAAILGVVFVNLFYQWIAEKDNSDDVTQALTEILLGDQAYEKCENDKDVRDIVVPKIYNLFRKKSIERILKMGLKAYCANELLAKGNLDYIKNNCKLIKKDEIYTVTIGSDENRTYIKQSLTDTRIFQKSLENRRYFIKSFLIFKKGNKVGNNEGVLDEKLGDMTFFFREELTEKDFIDQIIEKVERGESVIEFLDYHVFVHKSTGRDEWSDERADVIELKKVKVSLVSAKTRGTYVGLIIETELPKKFVQKSREFYNYDEYKAYRANVQIKYDIPKGENKFHVVYPVPAENPVFNLYFDFAKFNCNRDLEYMTFFSYMDGPSNKKNYTIFDRQFTFKVPGIIFPRSGISFYWRNTARAKCDIPAVSQEQSVRNAG